MHGTSSIAITEGAASSLSVEAAAYLTTARAHGFLDRIRIAFDCADQLKIAFVGETIIDEYCHVRPLAKPSKEFILATVAVNGPESFLGAVVAASRQGEWINPIVVTIDDQVIRKTRYVDADFARKLFEVYSEQQIALPPKKRDEFRATLAKAVGDADVVVVFDFGHGLMGEEERRIVEQARFLAVNAQTNSGNSGFNPVTKYARADYVCIDEPEARLAAGVQYGPLEDLADAIMQRMQCRRLVFTLGSRGAAVFDCTQISSRSPYSLIPAFADHGVDTIGAGDAFLAVSAPLMATGLNLEAAAFVGNIAGALKIDIVGHRRHVTRDALMQKIEALLR